jgi:DNA-binding response OmpR family regulator
MADRILVVDDDYETVNFLKIILSRQGYEVITAENGVKALELAHSQTPDLIVLDVMMPALDGFEVTRTLRGHPKTATIPILMFTAKTQLEDKVAGYEAGVDIYLTKPVHPVELQANIRGLLTQRKVQTASLATHGYMVGVAAAKGGLGVSTLALNLAIAYHQKHKSEVIAAELRPGQGTWAEELELANADGLLNLLQLSPPEITSSAVSDQLAPTNFGVRLLLASHKMSQVDLASTSAQYEAIFQQLPLLAPLVLLDVGTNYMSVFDMVMDRSQEMIVVVEPQPLAVKRTRPLLEELRKKGLGTSKALTLVVVNRTRADMVLSLSQIEETLGHAVTLGFPPASEQAYHAAMSSIPLYMVQPDGLVAQQFMKLAELLAQRVQKAGS